MEHELFLQRQLVISFLQVQIQQRPVSMVILVSRVARMTLNCLINMKSNGVICCLEHKNHTSCLYVLYNRESTNVNLRFCFLPVKRDSFSPRVEDLYSPKLHNVEARWQSKAQIDLNVLLSYFDRILCKHLSEGLLPFQNGLQTKMASGVSTHICYP